MARYYYVRTDDELPRVTSTAATFGYRPTSGVTRRRATTFRRRAVADHSRNNRPSAPRTPPDAAERTDARWRVAENIGGDAARIRRADGCPLDCPMTHPPLSPKLWLPYSSGRLCLFDHQVDISALHATPRSRVSLRKVFSRAFAHFSSQIDGRASQGYGTRMTC